ncbi:Uncharacterised protein [Yersinia mollaretii]|uniref:Uncharacterized protein n=1 Tax=Yersinia mollaretii TaxID=33060 RepID=A0AA36LQ55_YERMO|nr:Uncharacterised protein [Yersinia mollaretii]CNI25504.1 Uncharacterised protein [Yersinia mollaretii]
MSFFVTDAQLITSGVCLFQIKVILQQLRQAV